MLELYLVDRNFTAWKTVVASLRAQPWGSALISVGIGTNNSMSLISR